MRLATHTTIRNVLRNNPDGLTAKQIYSITNIGKESIRVALKNMPDVYLDRWLGARQGVREESVWCAVEIPEDCPRPERKIKNANK